MDTRIGQEHLMLLGQPDANLMIAGKAVWVLEFVLQCRQGCRGDTLVARGHGPLIVQGVVYTTLGIGPKPRRDAVPMHAQQRGNLLAVARVSTRSQLQGMEPLPLLEIPFAFHAALQLVGAFGHPWHRFAHLRAPPLGGGETKGA
jgi:hypothetical protein